MASQYPRLYRADVVVKERGKDDDHKVGMVARCYLDEAHQAHNHYNQNTIDRDLKEHEYGVLWYPCGERQIIHAKELVLVDRVFSIGSTCKRSVGDASSGVVTGATNMLRLQHLFSREEIDHPVPATDVVKGNYLNHGDLVVADDWIGEVDGVVEEALIGNPDNDRLVRVCEMGGRLLLGRIPKEHMGENEIGLQLVQLGIREASVVDIKQTVLYINWLAINQKLSPEEQAKRPKPKALWTDYSKLTLVKSFADRNHEIGDRVAFRTQELKDKHGAKVTYHGRQRHPVDVMLIVGTKTELDVLWQGGTRTKELACNMMPHVNLDEHESWPGDWVYWKSDDQGSVPRVVQSMDPIERTAELRVPLSEPAEIELVPSLEIDVQGADHSVFSLHRGDSVLISERPTGWAGPFLTTVGDPRPDYDDHKMHNDLMNAEVNVVTKEGGRVNKLARDASEATDIDWYGTVEELLLDGTCRVRLPCGNTVIAQLDKLQILSDSSFGMQENALFDDDPDNPWDDDYDSLDDDDDFDEDDEEDAMWIDQDGQVVIGGRDDWEDMSDGVPEAPEVVEIHLDEPAPASEAAPAADASAPTSTRSATPALQEKATEAIAASDADPSAPSELAAASSSTEWSQFAMLESAPTSHAFHSKPSSSQPNAAFFKRLQKELKVLQSSLPETILVRAYEDRSDLLRVLIIGSEGTPYENAPFLLDFQLTPDFPNKPPVAHFHSWTNGHGRVSPNLYEDGKVCLSVLGTWSGVAEENWTPSKSSLLQVFVSIQALVLVREPYFTEPAYEKLKGKDESKLNSKMYNEKAYILSRGFVKRALENPPDGFETELKLFYFKSGNLQKVVDRAEALVQSKAAESSGTQEETAAGASTSEAKFDADEAVQGLTKGGVIMLGRTLKSLHALLDADKKEKA